MSRSPTDPQPADTTLTDGLGTTSSGDEAEGERRQPRVWALTVLYHPDPRRIGARVILPWRVGDRVPLDRRGPIFRSADGAVRASLADRGVSRRPLTFVCTGETLRLEAEGDLPYRVAGAALGRALDLGLQRLRQGVLLECARRVVLWLDAWDEPPEEGARGGAGMVGVSARMEALRARIASLAPHALPVAITGESGTGKELVARALHEASPRAKRPWVPVNLGALNPSTASAELFGHARGAFTGADQARPGYFRRADGGTLFLDEIGSLPEQVQPMLLRALESGEIQPVGEMPRRVDVRLLTATDADLEQLAAGGRFFRPLVYRIRTTRLALPSLRERPADIPLLFVHFVAEQLEALGAMRRLDDTESPWLPRRVVDTLLRHAWPGNVRELRNVAVQTALECAGLDRVRLPDHFTRPPEPLSDPVAVLQAVPTAPPVEGRDWAVPPERLVEALRQHGWRVRPVADELGIARNTVYAMMGRLGIRRPGDLTREDILAAAAAVGTDDAGLIAAWLKVSRRGLKLRLRALGMTLGG